MTDREIVLKTLTFKNYSNIIPREIWVLPWAKLNYPNEVSEIIKRYPPSLQHGINPYFEKIPIIKGNPYEIGKYIDEWGCEFVNIQSGVMGQVKNPLVKDEFWEDTDKVHFPEELLTINVDKINEQCEKTDKFTVSGSWVHPFEQLQYIRTTELLYMDFADPPQKMLEFIFKMHDFYCKLLRKWAQTKIDALYIMDDWGSQQNLLINPSLWRKIFKPMYKEYAEIAHNAGKKIFMHSDGNILKIIPDLIDIGIDAINSQVACMGIENLKKFSGKITFWGEIDRQNILPYGSLDDVDREVSSMVSKLWKNGGIIAQCEFGLLAKPENVDRVFKIFMSILK